MSGDAIQVVEPDGTQSQLRGDANGYLIVTVATSTGTPIRSQGDAIQLLLPNGTQAQMTGDASGYPIFSGS